MDIGTVVLGPKVTLPTAATAGPRRYPQITDLADQCSLTLCHHQMPLPLEIFLSSHRYRGCKDGLCDLGYSELLLFDPLSSYMEERNICLRST